MSKPEMEFHMIHIMYLALTKPAQTEKTTFSCKDDYGKSLHICWNGARELYFDKAHMALDWMYSALGYLFLPPPLPLIN